MNTLESWKNWKDKAGELRGDPYEGLTQHRQSDGKLKFSRSLLKSNGYCMYALHSGDFAEISEENIQEFNRYLRVQAAAKGLGEHILFTHNTTEFLSRVDAALKSYSRMRTYQRGMVTYFDPKTFDGKIEAPGFSKTDAYQHQREYRFIARTARGTPLALNIGPIDDISHITNFENFNELLQISLPPETAERR